MLDRFRYPRSPYFPQIVVFVLWVIYLLLFGLFHNIIGNDLVALAFLPVIVAGWYFGATGGVLVAVLTIFVSGLLPVMTDRLSLAQAIHFAGWLNDLVLVLAGLETLRESIALRWSSCRKWKANEVLAPISYRRLTK